MAFLPAICQSCGVAFAVPSPFGGSGGRITMIDNAAGPCPRCGGTGYIPNGVFTIVNDALRLIQEAPGGMRRADLERLLALLEQAQRGHLRPDDVQRRASSDAPTAAPMLRSLDGNSAALAAWMWVSPPPLPARAATAGGEARSGR